MDKFDNNYILVIMGIIAITLEVILGAPTGFDLLLLGIIFVIGGGIGIATGSFMNALIIVTVLSFLYILLARKVIKEKLSVTTTKTNTDNLIGGKAVVFKKIFPHQPGQVKIEGELWRAEAEEELEVNKSVTVQSVSGVTLKVTSVNPL